MVRLPEAVIIVGSILLVRKGCANFVGASSEANRHAVQESENCAGGLSDPPAQRAKAEIAQRAIGY